MVSIGAAERSLREGDLVTALKQLQEQVRALPADAKLRIFLCQLLAAMNGSARSISSTSQPRRSPALAMAISRGVALRASACGGLAGGSMVPGSRMSGWRF
jgi:hypothetical protein